MLVMLLGSAGFAFAQANPPDHYLCYAGGATKTRKLQPAISSQRVDLTDRRGGPERFRLRRLALLCNPAGLAGSAVSHANVHLAGLTLRPLKDAPKFVPATQTVSDPFGTHTFVLTAPVSILDVTPAQPGKTAPADFNDDPTTSATEINRFKCYAVELPKGAPKLAPTASPLVSDEQFTSGQSFVVKKPTRLCLPADMDGATPAAPLRDTLLVCYAVKLPTGAKFARQQFGTRPRSVGPRIVGRRKPAELCVVGR